MDTLGDADFQAQAAEAEVSLEIPEALLDAHTLAIEGNHLFVWKEFS